MVTFFVQCHTTYSYSEIILAVSHYLQRWWHYSCSITLLTDIVTLLLLCHFAYRGGAILAVSHNLQRWWYNSCSVTLLTDIETLFLQYHFVYRDGDISLAMSHCLQRLWQNSCSVTQLTIMVTLFCSITLLTEMMTFLLFSLGFSGGEWLSFNVDSCSSPATTDKL